MFPLGWRRRGLIENVSFYFSRQARDFRNLLKSHGRASLHRRERHFKILTTGARFQGIIFDETLDIHRPARQINACRSLRNPRILEVFHGPNKTLFSEGTVENHMFKRCVTIRSTGKRVSMLFMLMLGKLLAELFISSEFRLRKAASWQIARKRQSAAQARGFNAAVAVAWTNPPFKSIRQA